MMLVFGAGISAQGTCDIDLGGWTCGVSGVSCGVGICDSGRSPCRAHFTDTYQHCPWCEGAGTNCQWVDWHLKCTNCTHGPSPPSPSYYTVSGYVRNSQDGTGIGGVAVEVRNNVGGSSIRTTNSSGRYKSSDLVQTSQSYAVRIVGNQNDPPTAPPGYVVPGTTTNNTSSWIDCDDENRHTTFGSLSYECQKPNHSNGDCAVGNSCNFAYNPFVVPYYTVTGYVRNSQTGAGIANVGVQVLDSGGASATVYTDSTGRYSNSTVALRPNHYAVRLVGNQNNPKTAPPGFLIPGKTTNNTSSWIDCDDENRHTPNGSPSYECQKPDHALGDCAVGLACDFEYDPPLYAQVLGRVNDTYYGSPNKYWSKDTANCGPSFYYNSQLNVSTGYMVGLWGCNTEPYYYIYNILVSSNTTPTSFSFIPPDVPTGYTCNNVSWNITRYLGSNIVSTQSGTVVSDGVSCRADIQLLAGPNTSNHLWWNIRPRTNSISGGLKLAQSQATCTTNPNDMPTTGLTPAKSVSYMHPAPAPNGSATFKVATWSGISYLLGSVASNVSGEISGVGRFYNAAGTTRYDLVCINGVPKSPSSPGATIAPFTTDITDYNFTYVAVPIFEKGWFQSINGDVYGKTLSTRIPPSPTGFSPYLAMPHTTTKTASVFSTDLNASSDTQIAQSSRFVKRLNYPIDLSSFDYPFIESMATVAVSNPNQLDNLQPNTIYKITSNGALTPFLASNKTYQISGNSDAVTVIYCSSAVCGNVNFNGTLTSSRPNARLIFIIEGSVTIKSNIGASSVNSTTPPHIQASIISKGNITFEKVSTGNDTLTIVTEGPLVSTAGQVRFLRNLGPEENARRPAHVVRFNDLYLRVFGQHFRQLGVADVTWIVDD
jgi:hypothetical protein